MRVPVFGAYRWPDGPFLFAAANQGGVNTDLFLNLLQQVARRARRIERQIVLVLDNGSAQTSHRSQNALRVLRPEVVVFALPTYSSEQLNDIENLWLHIKEDYFSAMLVERRSDFAGAVRALLQKFRRRGQLRRLLKPRPGGKIIR